MRYTTTLLTSPFLCRGSRTYANTVQMFLVQWLVQRAVNCEHNGKEREDNDMNGTPEGLATSVTIVYRQLLVVLERPLNKIIFVQGWRRASRSW